MRFDKAQGMARLKGVGSYIKKKAQSTGASIKKYQDEAPQRREKEISKLKDQIAVQKQRAELRRLREAARPRPSMGMGSMSQDIGAGMGFITGNYGAPKPMRKAKPIKRHKRRAKSKKKGKRRVVIYV